jgi:hypothetical protein
MQTFPAYSYVLSLLYMCYFQYLVLDTLNLYYFINVSYQLSRPYKTTGKRQFYVLLSLCF